MVSRLNQLLAFPSKHVLKSFAEGKGVVETANTEWLSCARPHPHLLGSDHFWQPSCHGGTGVSLRRGLCEVRNTLVSVIDSSTHNYA